MKQLSLQLLANTVSTQRKEKKMRQADLSKSTGINRSILSLIENQEFTPSINQLKALSEVLDFDIDSLFVDPEKKKKQQKSFNVAVAGTGYVGLSLAVLLAQCNNVTAVDIIPEKVEKLNNYI
ncbi:MAG: helix-turn-helix domain-containing protein, partial [Clostridiales bacterium]|nr:helix-turn-helix domain-containing protein [Clostridiales bacterium]